MGKRRQLKPKPAASAARAKDSWTDIPPLVLLQGVLLILVGLWIYSPAFHGAWLWDDDRFISNNAVIHSPSGFWKVWFNPEGLGNYYPLTALVEWLEWQLWGNNTLGYHLVCVALHLTSAFLLWRLFSRLGLPFAWTGAFLFAVHPIMVESVAWIVELKNTLSLPPLLLATLAWLDFQEKKTSEAYRSALLWFGLAMLAKTAGLMLPVIFLGYAWWKRGKIEWSDLRETVPFFAVSLVAGLLTIMPHHPPGAPVVVKPAWHLIPGLATMGWTVLFLLGKAIIPFGLAPDYAGFTVLTPTAFDLLPWVLLVAVGTLLGYGWRRWGWAVPVALALGFFLLNLVPVLVFILMNYAEMVWSLDHLIYLPIIGLIALAMSGLGWLERSISVQARPYEWAGIGAVLLVFCWGSYEYAQVYVSEEGFWNYVLDRDPQSWMAHDNLGNLFIKRQRYPEAVTHLEEAIRLKPDLDDGPYNLGIALDKAGRTDEAEEQYLLAVKLPAVTAKAYLNLGDMMRRKGDYAVAEKYLNQARAASVDDSSATVALAGLMIQTGRQKEALELYAQAVKQTSDQAPLLYNYGVALQQTGHVQEAVEQLRASIDLNDQFAPAHENLGVALAQLKQLPEAIEQFRAAIEIDPRYVLARNNLGLALVQTGRTDEGVEQFQTVIEIDPDNAMARGYLAKIRAFQQGTKK